MGCFLLLLGVFAMMMLGDSFLKAPLIPKCPTLQRTMEVHRKLHKLSVVSRVQHERKPIYPISVPNALTISRIYSIPVFLTAFLAGYQGTSLGIYIASCITDLLDGYLARKWNQMSDFGAFLDPVADKLMVATALILLTARFPTMLYILPVTLIMARELGVSALREWMAGRGLRDMVEVGQLGKLKTVFQMVSTTLLLAIVPDNVRKFDICVKLGISKPMVFTVGILGLYTSAMLTLLSGFQYLRAAWPTLAASADRKTH